MPVQRFVGKPIEAILYDGSDESFEECCAFIKKRRKSVSFERENSRSFAVIVGDNGLLAWCDAGNYLVRKRGGSYVRMTPEELKAEYFELI